MNDDLKGFLWKATKKLSRSDEQILLEQYKLYVEAADKISERRDKINNFFLTLNTLVIGGIGYLLDKNIHLSSKYIVILPLAVILAVCWFWYRLVKSYRQLNTAKYDLIGEVEKKLPARLWSSEWYVLGEGKDPSKYVPFSHIEQNIPAAIGIFYVISAVIYLWC